MKIVSLADLNPKLSESLLRFTCPNCREHYIVIPIAPGTGYGGKHWDASGDVTSLNVTPSIRTNSGPRCRWHGHIVDGQVKMDEHETKSESET